MTGKKYPVVILGKGFTMSHTTHYERMSLSSLSGIHGVKVIKLLRNQILIRKVIDLNESQ